MTENNILNEEIKKWITSYCKIQYNKYCRENKIKFIPNNEITKVTLDYIETHTNDCMTFVEKRLLHKKKKLSDEELIYISVFFKKIYSDKHINKTILAKLIEKHQNRKNEYKYKKNLDINLNLVTKIEELAYFFVKRQYNLHIRKNKITHISKVDLPSVVYSFVEDQFDTCQDYICNKLKLKYDLNDKQNKEINDIFKDIYQDRDTLKKKLESLIDEYQFKKGYYKTNQDIKEINDIKDLEGKTGLDLINFIYDKTIKNNKNIVIQKNVNESHLIYSQLSNIVYYDHQKRCIVKNNQYLLELSDEESGVFKNDLLKQIIISFRGTTIIKDLITDWSILRGTFTNSKRYKKSETLLKKIMDLYSDYKIILTGHSLGGTLAINLCSNFNLEAIVFNSGHKIGSNFTNYNITYYTKQGDTNSMLGANSYKNVIVITGTHYNRFKDHSIDNFL